MSRSTINAMITEDINSFVESIEKNEIVDKILISPFYPEGLQTASYEIHVGEECVSLTTGKLKRVSKEEPLKIEPGETVNILSREYVGLPQGIMAFVTSKVSLLEKGLTQISAYVDLGFHGTLIQTVTNLSNSVVELKYEEPFCQLIFSRIDTVKPDQRYRGRHLA